MFSSCCCCCYSWKKHDEQVLFQDWNQLLESIAKLRFCVPGNGSAEGELTPVPRKKSDRQSGNSQDAEHPFLLVPLMFKGGAGVETPSFLSTAVLGNQVGLKGKLCTQDLLHGWEGRVCLWNITNLYFLVWFASAHSAVNKHAKCLLISLRYGMIMYFC